MELPPGYCQQSKLSNRLFVIWILTLTAVPFVDNCKRFVAALLIIINMSLYILLILYIYFIIPYSSYFIYPFIHFLKDISNFATLNSR